MNFEKYKNDGWGISVDGFKEIYKILQEHKISNVVEFGSGISTKFFIDYDSTLKILSFDNEVKYQHEIAVMRPLVECSDESYELMFKTKQYNQDAFKLRTDPPHTRQKNCFYQIEEDILKDKYDLVILDGPHGNGRSISFLHLKGKLNIPSYIFIDDYNHYDFVDRCNMIFDTEIIAEKHVERDCYILLKIKGQND